MALTYQVAGEEREYTDKTPSANVAPDRHRFFFYGDDLILIDKDDDRPAGIIYQEYGKKMVSKGSEDEFPIDEAVRGYMTPSSICLYRTSWVIPVDVELIKMDIEQLMDMHFKLFGYSTCDIAVWTGCKIGKEGEPWLPLELVGKVDRLNRFHRFK